MPITRTTVTAAMMSMAGKLKYAPGVENGSPEIAVGMERYPPLIAVRNSPRYFAQAAATTAQAMAYSNTRSQPMIHAKSSPSVA